ncbi:MAG: PorV/PorQ family protein [Vicingaceae bacterium]
MREFRNKIQLLVLAVLASGLVWAGNDERAGQAGAQHLLVNPWSRSSGMGGAGSVMITGLEAIDLNVAGLAEVRKLEINFSHRDWLGSSSGIDINSLGVASHVGESGVIGLSFMSMSFGDIENTTVNLPEGGQGTFSPLFFNLALSYAKQFSSRINGGLTFRVVHEEITNVQANGIALDAGVSYTTGINDEIKFGIALKNVGPAMVYRGSGLTTLGEIPGSGRPITQEQRSQQYELPSLLNIGLSYDLLFEMVEDSLERGIRAMHRITPAFTFTSNSFTPDLFAIGAEYAFKEMFMGRLGYVIEGREGVSGLGSNALTGLSMGVTVAYPMSKKKGSGTAAIDFS